MAAARRSLAHGVLTILPMFTRQSLAPASVLLALVVLAACQPDGPRRGAARGGDPQASAAALPDDASASPSAAASSALSDEAALSGDPSGAAGSTGDLGVRRAAGGPSNGSSRGSGPQRDSRGGDSLLPDLGMGSDAVDMDRSGPMIHPTAPGADGGADSAGTRGTVEGAAAAGDSAGMGSAAAARPRADFEDARFRRPEHVRGLYVNAWAAGSSTRMEALIDLARRTEVNSFVIDIKDATGYLSHRTDVPLAHEIGATEERRIRDLPALLDRLEAEGIYPIARIVVVKDPLLVQARPDLAIQDTAGGIWIDSKEIIWLNPFERGVWEYNVSIAREVAEMGFPEIQWDYIRFPDAPEADYARAVFPGAEGKSRTEAIRGFLSYAKDELADLPVRSTADVFGVTTSFRRDIGLGQLWESFIDVVDVALPMVYPSHYWEGSFGFGDPNAYPYEVVRAALLDGLRRSEKVPGAGLTRPWIQDFTLGQPRYGAPEVRAQIQAAYDVGIQEWILWNPSTRYSEGALEPVEGFEEEPLIRVAGLLAPVSRRHLVMDSVAALPPPVDSLESPSPMDSAGARVDTVGIAVDTTGVAVDTVRAAADTVGAASEAPAAGPSYPFVTPRR